MQATAKRKSGKAALKIQSYYYREQGTAYHTPGHVHIYQQWFHLLRGSVHVRVGSNTYKLKPGHSVLIPPHTERELWCSGRPPAYFASIFELSAPIDLRSITDLQLPLTPDLEPDMNALAQEARTPSAEAEWLVPALLLRVLLGLKRNLEITRKQELSSPDLSRSSVLNRNARKEIVSRIDRFLRQNHGMPLRREEIAAHVALSPGHVARLYRAETGKTLVARLIELVQ